MLQRPAATHCVLLACALLLPSLASELEGDLNPHVQAIMSHCELWTAKFTGLLNTLAQRELVDVGEYLRASTAAQQQQPLQDARQVWRPFLNSHPLRHRFATCALRQ